ncbi:unnamed protein product [Phytophthora lilii]|uniref:Unnamed protein product n=1 Tax=Phytophthora lilii TaxID=2077276 RepID=A0A9W6X380_9STRA|nr:unnamed protein product [Phytophthora lilii]
MSVNSSPDLLVAQGELQSSLHASADVSAKNSLEHSSPLQLERRNSKALSISSLSNESANAKSSVTTHAIATEACRDVERELAAIETRLSVFRGRRRQDSSTFSHAVRPLDGDKDNMDAPVSPSSSVSSNAIDASSPTISKLSKAHQEAGAVAHQVATTLMKCDQLLQRVKSCGKW